MRRPAGSAGPTFHGRAWRVVRSNFVEETREAVAGSSRLEAGEAARGGVRVAGGDEVDACLDGPPRALQLRESLLAEEPQRLHLPRLAATANQLHAPAR